MRGLSGMFTRKTFSVKGAVSLLLCHCGPSTLLSSAGCMTRCARKAFHRVPPGGGRGWGGNESFFHFTRGRFVCDEDFEMSQRRIRFDMDKLAKIAASTVASKSCVAVEKYPDGQYSKAFLMTMEDGKQVVAKVPNPNAGPAQLTTASEVATMEFARNILATPVPQVYTWSSEAQSNDVGAEYIIMQKAPGVQLEHLWKKMDLEDQLAVIKQILRYQKTWASVSFNRLGSLYFAEDVRDEYSHGSLYSEENNTAIQNSRFVVGPSTGREYYDAGRASVQFDRGPWDTVEMYLAAIGNREINCVKSMPQVPKSPLTLRGPGTYMTCKEKKLKALQSYLTIAQYLLPTERSLTLSCLWHPDLHQENIFVNPEKPREIVAIIDWQSTELAPLFNQVRQPYFLDYEGPATQGFEKPKLPDNYAALGEASQKRAMSLFLSQMLSTMYRMLMRKEYPILYRTWEYQQTTSFSLLIIAQRLLIDGEAQYLASIVELESAWETLPGVVAQGSAPYPFRFSAAEKNEIEADAKGASEGMNLMSSVKDSVGRDLFPERGMVRLDQYDEAKDALSQIKDQVIDLYAHDEHERKLWEDNWPFDD